MGEHSTIEWTDATWNPIRGCTRVSPGCVNCYAERVAARFSGPGLPYEGLARVAPDGPRWTGEVRLVPERLGDPLRWQRPRRVFVNSMSDLFHEGIPDEWVYRIFAVMALASRHTFQVLTKRPERMVAFLKHWQTPVGVTVEAEKIRPDERREFWIASPRFQWPPPNVWLGVSVEDQQRADERIPLLLETPASVRFLSCEPLLGAVDLSRALGVEWSEIAEAWLPEQIHTIGGHPRVDWVIVGGESGPHARSCDLAWIRRLVRQCHDAGVAYFVKQLGSKAVGDGLVKALRDRKGGDPSEWPGDLRVRQMPGVSHA